MEDEDDSAPESKWRRPSLPPIDPSTDSIVFQHIDIESYVSSPVRGENFNDLIIWLKNHPKFLLHFLMHIDVLMLCRKFELIPT